MIVGVITGIVYASGVILKEVRSGEMSPHVVFLHDPDGARARHH
mgnify:CR=1 FL=1